jgi:hypothetical protein
MRKTMRELKQEARYEALAEMRERVADGSLLIRQMTAEERARHAPRPRATPSPGRGTA